MLQKLLSKHFVTVSRDICDTWLSISYSEQLLGKRESQTRQVFNFAVFWF